MSSSIKNSTWAFKTHVERKRSSPGLMALISFTSEPGFDVSFYEDDTLPLLNRSFIFHGCIIMCASEKNRREVLNFFFLLCLTLLFPILFDIDRENRSRETAQKLHSAWASELDAFCRLSCPGVPVHWADPAYLNSFTPFLDGVDVFQPKNV
jgi:hypothetical protein